MELEVSCMSPKMSIQTSASQRDDSIELCVKGNKIELRNTDGIYNYQVGGHSLEKGSVDVSVKAYGANGQVIDIKKTTLIFELKTYASSTKSTVNSPKKGMTYYAGDTLLIDFTPIDTSKNYEVVKGVIYLHNKASILSSNGYCEDCTREIVSEFAKGHYTWQIPSNIKAGEYYLEISNIGQSLDNYTSSQISAINFAFGFDNSFNIVTR